MTTSTNTMKPDTVYLTGSSGFIGQMIVQLCETDDSIAKVYCPIRDKHGETGQERFHQLFLSDHNDDHNDNKTRITKACFVDAQAPIPADVTLLVLNAYSVKFARPIVDILNDNVAPMLRLLDQCCVVDGNDDNAEPSEKQQPHIRGISVVSTAYVQPPLPFRRDADNRIEFLLRQHTTAYQLYQDLITGSMTPDQVMSKIDDPRLVDFYAANGYAFSKHIMEHVLHERYSHLPLCIVRPSIVAPSRDGLHGHGVRSGFSLFLDLARHPVLRFPRNEGKLSLVYVEDVAADILQGAAQWAQPATSSHTRGDSGAAFHPILSSTTESVTDALQCFQLAAQNVWRWDVRHHGLRSLLRFGEIALIRLVKDQRSARMVEKVYQNFDPIMKDQWDFAATHPPVEDDMQKMMDCYYAVKEKNEGTTATPSSSNGSLLDGGNYVFMTLLVCSFFVGSLEFSPALQVTRLFILLRMAVLLVMQTVFYGDTPVRNLASSTLNKRPHDSHQHDREEIIWPSVLISGVELYALFLLGLLPDPSGMPLCTWNSFYIVLATHAVPVEFIYYWGHRWMHSNPKLYKIHKHHHLSIVPSPKTSVTFLWSEHVFYDLIFALPVLAPYLFGEATIASTLFYVPLMDFVNTLGHTNLEGKVSVKRRPYMCSRMLPCAFI